MDLVNDLIEAILGVTLEELLTSITAALAAVQNLLRTAIVDLAKVAEGVDGEAEETIKDVVENMFVEALKVFLG